MRFYGITVGENKPDLISRGIQEGLSLKHGVEVNKSHAAILVEDAGPWSGIWESLGNGFHGPKDPVKALEGATIRDKFLLNVINDEQAIRWLRDFVGTPYARLQYLIFVPRIFAALVKWAIPRFIMRFIRNGKMLSFCSESVAHFIRNNCRRNDGIDGLDDVSVSQENCDRIDPYLIVGTMELYGERV